MTDDTMKNGPVPPVVPVWRGIEQKLDDALKGARATPAPLNIADWITTLVTLESTAFSLALAVLETYPTGATKTPDDNLSMLMNLSERIAVYLRRRIGLPNP